MDHGKNLPNVELHSLYSSPNIVKVIMPRRMRWLVHAVCMGEGEVFAWEAQREETTGKTYA
jgi:hypothetical protein